MQSISDKINILYKQLFLLKTHPFYKDFEIVDEINNKFIKYKEKMSKEKINYTSNIAIPKEINSKFKKENEKFDMNILKQLSIEIDKPNTIDNIIEIVNKLYNMDIPSNVPDLNKLVSSMKSSNKINIAIIGAGPVGLFLACYLFRYYNFSYGLNNSPKVNIIVFDNRLSKEGFKKPYTRNRVFAFDSSFFSFIIPNIYSWDNSNNGLLIFIYVLEYVLFTLAYYTFNIPFIFKDYSWDEYKQVCKDANIQIVFDCTGGRLNPPIFKKVDSDWLDIFNKNKTKYPNLNISPTNNIVTLDTNKDNFIKNYYYGNLNIYNNKSNEFIKKLDITITNYHDLKLFINIKDKLFTKESILKIISMIKDDIERNFIYNTILKYTNFNYKVDIFHTNMKHAIEISRVVNHQNHNFLYIASGDTIYHSHFITGSGLNRTITIAAKCANFTTNISLI